MGEAERRMKIAVSARGPSATPGGGIRQRRTQSRCDALAGEVEAQSLPKSRNASDSRSRRRCFIQVEAAVVDRMRAMRRPGES
jgi:hypothetical protein